jgi:hypothetical protein
MTTTEPTIDVGATGQAVVDLQTALNKAGANPVLAVDGSYGPLTLSAVVAFKHKNNLEDGIIGPVAWGVLQPVTPPPPPVVQPAGPSGTWKLVWSDEFPGTSVDTSKWYIWDNGTLKNGTPCYASNVFVSGGYLNMVLKSTSSGSSLASASQFGGNPIPPNGYRMKIGDVVESRILFPTVNGRVANWPSIWFFVGPTSSGAGEIDLFEGLGGSATCNYHPPSGAATVNNYPSGSWAGAFHTYTVKRNASSYDAYVDGQHFLNQPTSDDGTSMSVLLVNGSGKFGGPLLAPGIVQVDYVRAWTPA